MYICGVVNIALQRASFFRQRQVKHSSPAVFFVDRTNFDLFIFFSIFAKV